MAKSKGEVLDFTGKKENEDPVTPCQSWMDPCEFCDKRFGNWVEASEEDLAKVPTKPGIFMVGLKSKNSVEVVDIAIDTADVQRQAFKCIDRAKECVADKKSKVTKCVVVCRWMVFKHSNDKDVTSLCAHWFNNGVLPKFLDAWPGLDILQKSDNLMFSDYLQKWCYPKKDAFWRKPKSLPTKMVEDIQGCDFTQPCEICDNYFGKWMKLDDVVANERIPEITGIYMIAVHYGKNREVVDIVYHGESIKLSIKESIEKYAGRMNYFLRREKKFANKNPFFEVRWTEFNDPDSDNCCFLYAHWLNAETRPMLSDVPGKKIVEKNKHFVIRTRDNKWCYELDVLKPVKTTKFKHKKDIMHDLEEDIRLMNCDQ